MKIALSFLACLLFSLQVFSQNETNFDNETESTEANNIAFAVIEKVPIYPGCEGDDNYTLKKCMSDKISGYVAENFNMGLVYSLNLPADNYRISVQFKIDKIGNIVDVRARAPHPTLEKEAIRVVNRLPQCIPGMQKGKAVGVIYALPIIFKIEETAKQKKEREKKEKKEKRKKN